MVDKGRLLTVAVALFLGSLLAWTMDLVLITAPSYITAIFVWPVACTLVYGLVMMARGRS